MTTEEKQRKISEAIGHLLVELKLDFIGVAVADEENGTTFGIIRRENEVDDQIVIEACAALDEQVQESVFG